MVMRTAKLSWLLFVLALGLMGCTKAQDKKEVAEKPTKKTKAPEQHMTEKKAPEKLVKEEEEGIAILVKDLENSNRFNRVTARKALEKIGLKAVPALIEALDDTQPQVVWSAAEALGNIGTKAEKAVPALRKVLGTKESVRGAELIRREAAIALWKITSKTEKTVPVLIYILNFSNESDRELAADALGDIGPKAKKAIPDLTKAAQEADRGSLRTAAKYALKKIQQK
jgi:HEAT repeat protein